MIDEWTAFYAGATWPEVFHGYAQALSELLGYCRQHPDAKTADVRIAEAMQVMVLLHPTLTRYASDREALQGPPPVTLSRAVMDAIGQTRRALPQPTFH